MREEFAETLYELVSEGNHMANECERFGMTWGCKEDCPVFERGECELQEDNKKMFNEMREINI